MTPEQAYRMVRTAIERGDLVRPATCPRCGACDTKRGSGRHTIQAHHHAGYDRPLDVEWLCAKCHRQETPKPTRGGPPAFGEANGQAKLTEAKVRQILSSPLSSVRLAELHGVHKTTIRRIRRGEAWTSLSAASPTNELPLAAISEQRPTNEEKDRV